MLKAMAAEHCGFLSDKCSKIFAITLRQDVSVLLNLSARLELG